MAAARNRRGHGFGFFRRAKAVVRRSPRLCQLGFETLEDRAMLSVSLSLNGPQTILPGATINVSNNVGLAQSEMSLVINPTNPLNLVGFSHRLGTPITMDVYSSANGGLTWTTQEINNADDGLGVVGNRFDPSLQFDANGVLYIAYGYRGQATAPLRNTLLVVARSNDGGLSFGNYVTVETQPDILTANPNDTDTPGLDKWYVTTGLDPASGSQAVYLAYLAFVSEASGVDSHIAVIGSRDGGATWTPRLVINDDSALAARDAASYASPIVDSLGRLAVSWGDTDDNSIVIDRDVDGLWSNAATFGNDVTVRTGIDVARGTVLPPSQPQRGINAAPMLEVWRSVNRLYIPVVEKFNGSNTDLDVWVGVSSDFGDNWIFSRIDDSGGTEFNPWLQVDPTTGAVSCLYYTTDGDVGTGNDDVRPRLAMSNDGGVTWTRNYLSAQTSNEAGGYGGDYLEYIGLGVRDGTAHGLWASRYPGGGTDLDALTANAAFVSSTGDNRLLIGERGGADDSFLIQQSAANPDFLEVFVDGVREFTGLSATLDKIIINPGGGINTFNIGSLTGISSVTINGTNNIDVYDIVSLGLNAPLSIVLAGGNDAVTLGSSPFASQLIQSPVTIFGDAGNDTLTLGSNNADSIDANVTFNGGASLGGVGDQIIFNDFAPTYNVSYDIASTVVTRDGFNVPRTVGYSSVEGIVVNAGSGADTVTVRSAVTPLVTANGNNGNDTFIIGGGNMNGYVPQLFNGGQGIDQITFDDSLNPAGKLWDINQDFHPNEIIYSGLITLPTTGFESVGILAGLGVDNITFYNDIRQNYSVDGGAVNSNTFRWNAANNYFRNPDGPDASYTVDLVLGPASASNLLLFEDISRLETDYYVTDSLVSGFDTFTSLDGFDVAYHNAGFVTINGSNERNTFQLMSADPAATYSFFARGGNDRFELTLDPASGGQSIRTDGNDGSDSLFITDAAFSAASSYAINSSAVTRTSSGGSRFFSLNTMESITVGGTAGDDVFGVGSFTSGAGLTVRGADGNDTLNFGNGNLSASITNIASFTFDGQADSDTFNLRNAASTAGYTYRRNIGTMSAVSGAYVLNLSESNVESVFLDAGSGADVFRITAVAAGTELNLSAGAGIDALLLGDLSFSVSEIAGPITFDTGADFGRVSVTDVNSTVGKVAHLDLTSLGANAGDTLFGPGGSLRFTTLVNQVAGFTFDAMSLLLGSGADTIYAQPFGTGTVGIEGRNPTAAPGDTLSLALATAENYVVNGTPASGNITSSNLMKLSYFGFETGPVVDDAAPFIVAQGYDDSVVPTIFVEFSEDVSGALSVNFLELVNTTTSEQIAFGLMTLSYDAGTSVASYTFPGYVDGVLPAGDYTATIDGTLVDAFGNAMGIETPFNFSVVVPASGDFDSDGDADGADFLAWQRGLGIAAPDATRPDGDADGDRDVDGDDLAVWVQQFPAAEVVVSSGNGYSAAAGGAAERMFALGGALSAERVDDAVAGAAAEYANYDLAYRDGFVFNARTVFDPLSTVAGLSLNGGSREERGGEKLSARGFSDDRLDAAVVDLLFARLL